MTLARIKVWNPGDVLTAADLNAEFNNILNNPGTLISPLTGNLDFGNFQAVRVRLENVTTTQAASQIGRVMFNTSDNTINVDDGSFIRKVPTILSTADLTIGNFPVATSAPSWTQGKSIFANFGGSVTSSQITPTAAFGFSTATNSIVRASSGDYTLTFSNQISQGVPLVSLGAASTGGVSIPVIAVFSTLQIQLQTRNLAGNPVDPLSVFLAVIGTPV